MPQLAQTELHHHHSIAIAKPFRQALDWDTDIVKSTRSLFISFLRNRGLKILWKPFEIPRKC